MTARTCPECGGLAASTINTCPHCGHHFAPEGAAMHKVGNGANPYNNIGWCILALITFWPLAIAAFVCYFKSDNRWLAGDVVGAEQYGTMSRRFAKVALWLVIIPILLLIILSILSSL